MFEVEVSPTPGVLAALDSSSREVRQRFIRVARHLQTRPRGPDTDSAFWDEGQHFEVVQAGLSLAGMEMDGIRVVYHPQHFERFDGPGRHVIKIYAFSVASSRSIGGSDR